MYGENITAQSDNLLGFLGDSPIFKIWTISKKLVFSFLLIV